MGCALLLELGVLILEWAEICDKAEHDGAKCGLKGRQGSILREDVQGLTRFRNGQNTK